MTTSLFDREENIVGKGENAGYQHLLYLQCFQKVQIFRSGDCVADLITVKPVLETTCIKRPPALRDHYSDTTTLLKPA